LKMSQTSIEENTTRVRLLKKKARNVWNIKRDDEVH
jgi:hypothetical protein